MGARPEDLDELKALFEERAFIENQLIERAGLGNRLAEINRKIAAKFERLGRRIPQPIPDAVPALGSSPRSAIITPLKARVFAFLGTEGDGKTLEEIALGVEEKNLRRVDLCLRDARAKKGLLEKPVNGRWTRTELGRQYSQRVVGKTLWEHLREEP